MLSWVVNGSSDQAFGLFYLTLLNTFQERQ